MNKADRFKKHLPSILNGFLTKEDDEKYYKTYSTLEQVAEKISTYFIDRNYFYKVQGALIKINGLREEIKLEVAELEAMRKGVTDNQRAKLEMRISNRRKWVKELDDIELDFREEL